MKDRYDPGTKEMFDIAEARRRRDKGMKVTAEAAEKRGRWFRIASVTVLRNFTIGWEGLAEEFQPPVKKLVGEPHVKQVWGSLSNSLIRAGFFIHVGDPEYCKKATNHARVGRRLRRIG